MGSGSTKHQPPRTHSEQRKQMPQKQVKNFFAPSQFKNPLSRDKSEAFTEAIAAFSRLICEISPTCKEVFDEQWLYQGRIKTVLRRLSKYFRSFSDVPQLPDM